MLSRAYKVSEDGRVIALIAWSATVVMTRKPFVRAYDFAGLGRCSPSEPPNTAVD